MQTTQQEGCTEGFLLVQLQKEPRAQFCHAHIPQHQGFALVPMWAELIQATTLDTPIFSQLLKEKKNLKNLFLKIFFSFSKYFSLELELTCISVE